jgi:thiol-disulfide isomerase/thioredoxin
MVLQARVRSPSQKSLRHPCGRKIDLKTILTSKWYARTMLLRFRCLVALAVCGAVCDSYPNCCVDAAVVGGQEAANASRAGAASKEGAELLPIFDSVEDGLVASEELDRPVVVLFTASWCGPCKELTSALTERFEAELLKPSANSLFRSWVIVKVDVDERKDLADRFEIRGVPAMRVLDLNEKVLAKSEGYDSYASFAEWLDNCKRTSTPRVQRSLQNSTDLSEVKAELVVLLGDRNVEIRERAMHRLSSDRKLTQRNILEVMQGGSLAQRLCSLEILRKWGVDVSGFDPWKPETFQDARIAKLRDAIVQDGNGKD